MDVGLGPWHRWTLALVLGIYAVAMIGIAWMARRRVESVEDYIVAGRRLPLSLAWMTLLATWFGAGTMITVADEVRESGLQAAALDPVGAGFCLLFVGLWVAAPLWRMQLLTVPDFYRQRFGPLAEKLSAVILVPSYFGWIAAQLVALAGILDLVFGIPPMWGIAIAAAVGGGYTALGGMWAVTWTDAVQITLVIVGLVVLTGTVLWRLGEGSLLSGMALVRFETAPEKLIFVPRDSWPAMLGWLSILLTGALGNVPVQDLMQRVFAARTSEVARRACLMAGGAYLLLGALPIVLALSADLLIPDVGDGSVLPLLAQLFLTPAMSIVFLLALLSAILSTIDSAILSPASVVAQNLWPRRSRRTTITAIRVSVLGVTGCSAAVAYSGDSAYAMLEEAYAMTLVGLFVPMMAGLFWPSARPVSAVAAMLFGIGLWAFHWSMGWDVLLPHVPQLARWQIPIALAGLGASALGLVGAHAVDRIGRRWGARADEVRPEQPSRRLGKNDRQRK